MLKITHPFQTVRSYNGPCYGSVLTDHGSASMGRVLFLQKLDVSRETVRDWLKRERCSYEPIMLEDGGPDPNDVKILVTKEHHVDAELLDAWPMLEMVSLGFTGYDEVDLTHAQSRGIQIYYVPGYATASVAELNLGLTLSLLRKIPLGDRTNREGKWHHHVYPGIELAGKNVGILGTGTIGLQTAQLFRAFNCAILGLSRTKRNEFLALGGDYVSKEKFFRESDIVVICLALNEHTLHFIGETELGWMKQGSFLINTARGELVDQNPLIAVLKAEKISAGIDVYEHEPPQPGQEQLFDFANVITTPHIGFKTREALSRLAEKTIENIGHFFKKDPTNRLV